MTKTTISIEDAIDALCHLAAADGRVTPKEKTYILQFADRYDMRGYVPNAIAAAEREAAKMPKEVSYIGKNKAKGDEFERAIVDMLASMPHTRVLEWRSDKFTGRVTPEGNLMPDIRLSAGPVTFSVECKYTSFAKESKSGEYIAYKKDQIDRYARHEAYSKEKVLIAQGVGGSPSAPHGLYIFPLSALAGRAFITLDALERYRITEQGEQLLIRLMEML